MFTMHSLKLWQRVSHSLFSISSAQVQAYLMMTSRVNLHASTHTCAGRRALRHQGRLPLQVHHLAGLLRVSVRSNMAKARKRWQRHRQAVREKGAQMQSSGGRKSGLHLHLLRLRRRDSDVQHDSR